MVCCTYHVGFNLWGIWIGMRCVIMKASVFLNPGVGFSIFHLPTNLHLVPKYYGLLIIRYIVPNYVILQGEGTPKHKGNVHLFTYPFNDCSLSVPHCTGSLVEEHWIRECRGQGVVLTHCLMTVHLNQPGVFFSTLDMDDIIKCKKPSPQVLSICINYLSCCVQKKSEATFGYRVNECYPWLTGDVCYGQWVGGYSMCVT